MFIIRKLVCTYPYFGEMLAEMLVSVQISISWIYTTHAFTFHMLLGFSRTTFVLDLLNKIL